MHGARGGRLPAVAGLSEVWLRGLLQPQNIELGGLIGVYSRADERVALVVFAATTTREPRTTAEATEVRGFAAAGLPWDELAFWSTELALRDALAAG